MAALLAEFTAALDGCCSGWCGGGGGGESSLQEPATPRPPPSPAVTATARLAARGLSDMITRPPVALVGEDKVEGVVRSLTSVLAAPGAWGGSGGEGGAGVVGGAGGIGAAGVDEGTAAFAVLAALR